jgi:hypothetical protein
MAKTKVCTQCEKRKSTIAFYWTDGARTMKRSECIECWKARQRERMSPDRKRCPTCGYIAKWRKPHKQAEPDKSE